MVKKCNCKKFMGIEEYHLRGEIDNNILYIKTTGESNGFDKIHCEDCKKLLDESIRIEICY